MRLVTCFHSWMALQNSVSMDWQVTGLQVWPSVVSVTPAILPFLPKLPAPFIHSILCMHVPAEVWVTSGGLVICQKTKTMKCPYSPTLLNSGGPQFLGSLRPPAIHWISSRNLSINIGLVWISLLAMLKGPLDVRGDGMGKVTLWSNFEEQTGFGSAVPG